MLPQAGRLRITGSGFGAQQGASVVKIGGANAPVSNWTDSAITTYVPDNSPSGSDSVQVISSNGTSNSLLLQVTPRPAASGHVKWRFMADGYSIGSRPAVGADGTVYAVDTSGHLYSLTPTGGVNWIFNGGGGNVRQPVSVGSEGTIYFASLASVFAVYPDGSLKWKFTDPGFALVFAGPTVGPDGNIYAVTDDVNTPNALGAFVLSPGGTKLSNLNGFSTRFGYSGIEIAFGPTNHWYFTNNASGAVAPAGSLWGFDLGGTNLAWHQPAEGQPRVKPNGEIVVGDGTAGHAVHPGILDFTATGNQVFHVLGEGTSTDAQSNVDLDGSGNIYLATLTYGTGGHFRSLNPNGSNRWQFRDDDIATDPAVSPFGTLVLYSAVGYDMPSHVNALNTANGQLLWREDLPVENGGNIQVASTARFAMDGSAAYLGTVVNATSDTYSYLYAFVTGTPSAAAPIAVSRKTHGATGVYDLNLPLSGTPAVEPRSGGTFGSYQVVLTFPTTVTYTGAALTTGTGTVSSVDGSGTKVLNIFLSGVVNAQSVALTVSGLNDGNAPVHDVVVPLSFLLGDSNGDGTVNSADATLTRRFSGQACDWSNYRSDYNLDGSLNSADATVVRMQSGSAL